MVTSNFPITVGCVYFTFPIEPIAMPESPQEEPVKDEKPRYTPEQRRILKAKYVVMKALERRKERANKDNEKPEKRENGEQAEKLISPTARPPMSLFREEELSAWLENKRAKDGHEKEEQAQKPKPAPKSKLSPRQRGELVAWIENKIAKEEPMPNLN